MTSGFVANLAAILTPAGIFWAAVILGLSVFLHELGHFWAARRQGVAVPIFSVGMGPVIWSKTVRGTDWRLSLLPIGGYVIVDGKGPSLNEDGSANAPTHGYAALKPRGKAAVLAGGVIVNGLLALGLMTASVKLQGLPAPEVARVSSVVAGSEAERLGLQAGDLITHIGGQPLQTLAGGRDGYTALGEALKISGQKEFLLRRGGETVPLSFVWRAKDERGAQRLLGVRYGPEMRTAALDESFVQAARVLREMVPNMLRGIGNMFLDFFSLRFQPKDEASVGGPLRITEVVGQASAEGAATLLFVGAMINLSFALFNALPIPGLDGGQMLLLAIEALRGRPLSPKTEQSATLAGALLVLGLTVWVALRDVARLL